MMKMDTVTSNASNANIDLVKQAILEKDKQKTIELLENLKNSFATDEMAMQIITMPPVITELHQMLMDNLGVHPRAMQLRARVPNRGRRATLFVQAMINGVKLSK
jgi:hypothetical protein